MNSIFAIHPYKKGAVWVFDDEKVGLRAEPFVGEINDMIDNLVKNIPKAHKGFTVLFSPLSFPGYDIKLTWVKDDFGGNWYYDDATKLTGWLCPQMYQYLSPAPKAIYIQSMPLCK